MQAALDAKNNYYETLNRLYGITTAAVILLCLLLFPFFPLSESGAMLFIGALAASTVLTFLKYIILQKYMTHEIGFYATDILNPIMTAILIYVSGRYGLYLYFIFFLQMMGSLALLNFKHVIVSATTISALSVYLFFIANSFGLSEPDQYAAGMILLVVLLLITVFSFFIMQEKLRTMTLLNTQKSMFIQDVSHELRTPLTVIKGVANILKDGRLPRGKDSLDPESDRKIIEYLQSATTDLETITERLSVESRKKIEAEEHDQVTKAAATSVHLSSLENNGNGQAER